MKAIELTKGQVALVDDEDYEYLNQWKWGAQKSKQTFYAERNEWNGGHVVRIRMHRLLMNPEKGQIVDHVDGNGLNNQKNNLRIATPSQNGANKRTRGTSKYLGVSLCTRKYQKKNGELSVKTQWAAFIQINYVQKFLGYFSTEEEAAIAYNKAAQEVHGEFAKLNEL